MSTVGGPTTCHFVPPYLMQQLADTGTLDQDYVDACLRIDTEMRARRGSGRGGAPRDTDARWKVHTAGNTERLPGEPVRSEGGPPAGDETVDEAADGITATLDLFRDVYGRDSFDDAGARLLLTVHYGERYANAFWDGTHLVFGDGDQTVFRRFTRAVDVLAHEFTHAVTEHTAGLVYQGQSGALNESMSDVFAACLKQQLQGDDADGRQLADRRGDLRAGDQRARAARHGEPRHRLRRPRPRQGPAAGPHGRLRPDPRRQRRCPHQLRHPQPRLRAGRPRDRRDVGRGCRPDLVRRAHLRRRRHRRRLRILRRRHRRGRG